MPTRAPLIRVKWGEGWETLVPQRFDHRVPGGERPLGAAAEAGEVRISAPTHHLIAKSFQARAQGETRVAGAALPVLTLLLV